MQQDNKEQLHHYERKLAYEIDSWDLKVALAWKSKRKDSC